MFTDRKYKIELPGESYDGTTPNFSRWHGYSYKRYHATLRRGLSPGLPPIVRLIKQVGLVSSPTHDSVGAPDDVIDTFVRGDRIVIDVTFAEAMRVAGGTATATGGNSDVKLRVDVGGTVKKFPLERVLYGGQALRFAYDRGRGRHGRGRVLPVARHGGRRGADAGGAGGHPQGDRHERRPRTWTRI